jgi:nitrite reductase (cytochrome c-552)
VLRQKFKFAHKLDANTYTFEGGIPMTASTKSKLAVALATLTATACVAGLVACAPQANQTSSVEATQSTPTEDSFGVITADQWASTYPNQYNTWLENEENSPEGKMNYLEEYPELTTMYAGYGFSKGYDEAASHSYTLQSITETPRVNEKTLANCITCKTPQFTALVNSEGDSVYQMAFSDLIDQFTEPISCYNCHENDPTTLNVTNQFYLTSLGDDASEVALESAVCGQCHNEYYFNSDKVTSNPYTSLAGMGAEEMLAYYDQIGFSDWTHPVTGAAMLKAQHPEFETIYGAEPSHMANAGFTCADCHMATMEDEDGTRYASHNLVSPLESDELKEKCAICHDDIEKEVAEYQEQVTTREHEIASEIERYINTLGAQKDSLDATTLAAAQKIHRDAQFYWDYVMVENSEGAHNPELCNKNLDKAEELLAEGFALLGA